MPGRVLATGPDRDLNELGDRTIARDGLPVRPSAIQAGGMTLYFRNASRTIILRVRIVIPGDRIAGGLRLPFGSNSAHVAGRPSMSSFVFQNGLLGLFRILTTTIVAGWIGSPMSWSPDSQWLSYTVAPGSEQDDREPDWLFDTSREGINPKDRISPDESRGPSGPTSYRIWTTHRDAESSVLIEESAWPLTAPAWSPHGRSIAFGRFVPSSMEPHQSDPRGRLDVVIQDGLGRKQTVLTIPDFELDPDTRAEFPHVVASWSPDGQFLAFPKPGRSPAILIFRIESRKLLQTIDRAWRPSWSPDGSRLAFIRHEFPGEDGLELLERRSLGFVTARPIIDVRRVRSAPYWTGDGRSIFVVVEKAGPRLSELDLTRVFVESGDLLRVVPLAAPRVPAACRAHSRDHARLPARGGAMLLRSQLRRPGRGSRLERTTRPDHGEAVSSARRQHACREPGGIAGWSIPRPAIRAAEPLDNAGHPGRARRGGRPDFPGDSGRARAGILARRAEPDRTSPPAGQSSPGLRRGREHRSSSDAPAPAR